MKGSKSERLDAIDHHGLGLDGSGDENDYVDPRRLSAMDEDEKEHSIHISSSRI